MRKLALAVHLTTSVGWVGAVVAYIPLDVSVAIGSDAEVVRGAWIGMGLIASVALVPLSIGALASGLVMSVGTRWGLFRHWWVVISLALTVFAVVVLQPQVAFISRTAARAADPAASAADILAPASTLPHSVGGLLVLIVIQVLNIYKPQGLTPHGWRRQRAERRTR